METLKSIWPILVLIAILSYSVFSLDKISKSKDVTIEYRDPFDSIIKKRKLIINIHYYGEYKKGEKIKLYLDRKEVDDYGEAQPRTILRGEDSAYVEIMSGHTVVFVDSKVINVD